MANTRRISLQADSDRIWRLAIERDRSLTPPEVAKILSISRNTVYELIKRGELNAYRIGRKVRIEPEDVEEYKHLSRENAHRISPPDIRKLQTSFPPMSRLENFVICGQDVMLDILARQLSSRLGGTVPLRSFEGSYNGLYALYQGNVHAATAHLWDGDTGIYNTPFVRRMLPGTPAVIIRLASRKVGFIVKKGNPKCIGTWKDLARNDVRIVNREKGSGIRVLIDEKLRKLKIDTRSISGYEIECPSHTASASSVARGLADAAVASEMAAAQFSGVDFIFQQNEQYDMVIRKRDIKAAPYRIMTDIICSESFKAEIHALGGYDLSQTGTIIAET